MLRLWLFGGAVFSDVKANVGLAIVRVFGGLSMAFAHGIRKLPPSEGFIKGTGEMGFPLPEVFAWLAGLSEFGGGLLVAMGLATRPAAFFVACTMITAGFIRHAADPFGRKEMAFLYLSIMVMFLLVGAGRYGVDALLRKPNDHV